MKNMQKNDVIDVFTHNVKRIRKVNNLSKKRMSEILGISICSLNKIENGILPPRLSAFVLFKIQSYFKVPIKDLLDEKYN